MMVHNLIYINLVGIQEIIIIQCCRCKFNTFPGAAAYTQRAAAYNQSAAAYTRRVQQLIPTVHQLIWSVQKLLWAKWE